MAAKRMDPSKAKEAKQKKVAIGGAVLLLVVLAFQGPKTLKMLQGPQPVADPLAVSTPTPVPAAPVAGGTAPTAPTAPVASVPELSSVSDSDPAPQAAQGQLATFERFASKDPFAQQAERVVTPRAAPAPSKATEPAPATTKGDAPTSPSPAADGGTDAAFTAESPPEIAAATTISVNGVAEDIAVEASFPKDEPTFVLAKLAKSGKSVEIGIAGGAYAGGGETISLALGRKLTLQNTADGSRYELELLAIQGFPVLKSKK